MERPGYHKLMDFDKKGGKGELEEGRKKGKKIKERKIWLDKGNKFMLSNIPPSS